MDERPAVIVNGIHVKRGKNGYSKYEMIFAFSPRFPFSLTVRKIEVFIPENDELHYERYR